MKKTLLTLLLASVAGVAVAAGNEAAQPQLTVKPTDPVVVVGGKTILTVAQLESQLRNAVNAGAQYTPQLENTLVLEALGRTLVVNQALKEGLDKNREVAAAIAVAQENAKQTVLVQAMQADFVSKNQPTEAQLKAEYDRQVNAVKNLKEYRINNVVLKTEAEAKKLIANLKAKRTTFEKAAKTSLDTYTADKAGLVDWTASTAYLPEIRAVIEKTKKGVLVPTPIKTSAGYHVIRVDDVRPIQVVSFEDAKSNLLETMMKAKWTSYLDSLRKQSNVTYPLYEEIEKARANATTPAKK